MYVRSGPYETKKTGTKFMDKSEFISCCRCFSGDDFSEGITKVLEGIIKIRIEKIL